ncbi:Thaumatin-like protein [Glycine max]|nr:Thaumatin-like protein [Glycine max]
MDPVSAGPVCFATSNAKTDIRVLSNGGHPSPKHGGFHLGSGEEVVIQVPKGDCGGLLQCNGIGGIPPATLVEITLGTSQSPLHFYDVSLVDGFNLPASVKPAGGGGAGCGIAACEVNLNVYCPSSLVVERNGKVVGCKSVCLAAKSDRYFCTGEFAGRCKPTVFAHLFKIICPNSYSYAYVVKTCVAPRYEKEDKLIISWWRDNNRMSGESISGIIVLLGLLWLHLHVDYTKSQRQVGLFCILMDLLGVVVLLSLTVYLVRNPMASNSLNNSNNKEHFPSWTRLQNKQFEKALVLYDEHTRDRWQNIAKEVGNKSVEEVKRHYAILLEDLSRMESGRVPIPDYKFSENMDI